MERSREHWYEREEIKKITADWVKENCKLTSREKELLPIIHDRKLVRRDHLEIISDAYRNAGSNRTILLNRAIKKLFKMMILDKFHQRQEYGKGSFPATISIDRAGSLILGVPHKRRIIQDVSSFKGMDYVKRRLPANFRHINGVNQLEVDTILLCEQLGCMKLLWELEKPKSFKHNDSQIILIPDVLMVLDVGGRKLAAFIEYDTGSEGIREKEPKVLKDKILNYRKYRTSKLWEDEEWQRFFSAPTFPILLFVTDDEKRIEFFQHKADESKIKTISMHTTKYREVLKKLIEIYQKNN